MTVVRDRRPAVDEVALVVWVEHGGVDVVAGEGTDRLYVDRHACLDGMAQQRCGLERHATSQPRRGVRVAAVVDADAALPPP